MVGLGTVITGMGIIAFSAFFLAFEKTGRGAFTLIGTALMIVGIVVGLIISIWAMIKYNKGLF